VDTPIVNDIKSTGNFHDARGISIQEKEEYSNSTIDVSLNRRKAITVVERMLLAT